MLIADVAYLAAAPVARPFLVRKSLRTGKYRADLSSRFGFGEDLRLPRGSRLLLVHCVSVGELNSVATLLQRLLAADPALHLAVSTTTDTGTERAHERIHPVRFPFDFSFSVEQFLDRVRPDGIVLIELETWPNFLSIARSRRIPVALINGRISERSFPRYRMIKPAMGAMLRKLTWIAAQTETIAGRFAALGAPRDRLEVLPTLKYDNANTSVEVPGKEALAAATGVTEAMHLHVAGSTGPGEEEALLDTYTGLVGKHPELRLALVPRHPEVVPQVIAAIQKRGLLPVLRTVRPDGTHAGPLGVNEVFVLNTMGELRKLYALASSCFVGRSLVNLGGSDMIEAAAMGKPVCFGPYTANFAEAVELLTGGGAARVVQDARALQAVLGEWLEHPAAAHAEGASAQMLIERQKGSTARYVERLRAMLSKRILREGMEAP